MSSVTRAITIDAPPDAVWTVLADFGAIAEWAPNVDHSSPMTDPSTGVGAARRVQVGRLTLVERVVAWEPPTSLAYELEGLPPVVSGATNTWTIEPAAGGSTVTLTTRVEPGPRPPHRLAAKLVARKLAGASDELLAGLEHHVYRKVPGTVRYGEGES